MTRRENILRAVRFERPETIPVRFHFNQTVWHHYDQEALKDLCESHPVLFPGYVRPEGEVVPDYDPVARAGEPYTDPWGCVWETTDNGTAGIITTHPLADWDAFDDFTPPDPKTTDGRYRVDWRAMERRTRTAREHGDLAAGGLPHGHTFMLLMYLRGYENLIYDMADDEPRLHRLIGMVEDFNLSVVERLLETGIEWMGYAEDLGAQRGPLVSPEHLRQYIKPSYERLMRPARERGVVVHMHSDGDVRTLAPDLIDGGVEALNLQDLVNGIDWIAANLKGKVCIDLDVDRQKVTRFGTPADVDELIRTEVETLGSPEGGLMLNHGFYVGVPLENVKAVMDAMEKYAAFHA